MTVELELFARRLKSLRLKRKLTLERLAELSDLTSNHIAKLEAAKSNPSFPSLTNIAKALNVEIKDLFDFDEFKDENNVRTELKELIEHAGLEYLNVLYKVHKSIIN